jgi:hypothetical protein
MGEECETPRPYLCEVNMIAPELSCVKSTDPAVMNTFYDPVCLQYSVHDTIRFEFKLNCSFTDTTDIEVCFIYF